MPETPLTGQPPLIGIDLGGTKIALVVLSQAGEELFATRRPTPQGDYHATLQAIRGMVTEAEDRLGLVMQTGIGIPGSVSPATGLVQNANSTWLNGKPFHKDLANCLRREVRTANDANCLALSEAADGAGQDASPVFGVILGTGCGGGLVHGGTLIQGHRHIGGEWGHTPLPWAQPDEYPGNRCWCGRSSCMETWVSGPALAEDHFRMTGQQVTAEELYSQALDGNTDCLASLERHTSRLARGLAMVSNILDPEVIVLGGGLSKMSHLYEQLPEAMRPHIFSDNTGVDIRPPRHGDASGVRGAARLWQDG